MTPRMKLVNRFHQLHFQTNSYSLFKEAARYCTQKGLEYKCEEEEFLISCSQVNISSLDEKCRSKLKSLLRSANETYNLQTVLACSWQGVIIKAILEDETVMKGNFYWLSGWKTCPTSTISEVMQLLYQMLDT